MTREIVETKVLPTFLGNWIQGKSQEAASRLQFEKFSPSTGKVLFKVARAGISDIQLAIENAKQAQLHWAALSPVSRGKQLLKIARLLEDRAESMASLVALETGKSHRDAIGEIRGAVQLAEFFAGEGMRLYGQTIPSGLAQKQTFTVREPLGIAVLIVASNAPVPNIAWKLFPALICGNAAILKASEDAPLSAYRMAQWASEAGLPDGLFNVIQGIGAEVGPLLTSHPDIDVISFTGSTRVGKQIAAAASPYLTRLSLELGGKNPLVVCEDADIDLAVHWALLSSFSNAGQRCASSSRIIVFDAVYETFKQKFLTATRQLKIGSQDTDNVGPVINLRQMNTILEAIQLGVQRGATLLCGGKRMAAADNEAGYYIEPTIFEEVPIEDELSQKELFGPVTVLYRCKNLTEAILLANATSYGLTAAIHTKNIHRAMVFSRAVRAGMVNVNLGTHGSEPHYPFGGFGDSGNGSREPGVQALNVYSELKSISLGIEATDIEEKK